jgi:methyl-accepting chemotaxis protein
MSRALRVFRDALLSKRRLEQENAVAKAHAEASLLAERKRVSEIFRSDVMQAVMIVSGASTELQRSATFMRDRAIETDQRAQTVVDMSGETIAAVGSLSQSSSHLSRSVGMMNDQLMEAAQIAVRTVTDGHSTSQSAHELLGAVEAIGKIADFIADVAYRINLLALNATIEAARCGEMGRGFGVVAAEVKHLAHATSRAAADIEQQLAAVKSATDYVVKSVDVTVEGISRIGEMAGALEAAHGQKEVVTRHVSACVESVVTNAKHVAEVIYEVGLSTGETQRVADAMLAATLELSEQAERLLSRSHDFCEKIALSDAA